MSGIKLAINRRLGSLVALVALVAATLAPTVALAAQLTTRSVALSSTSASATSVTYQVNFTAVSTANQFLVDFCTNSPTIGDSCTAPTGMVVTSAASTTSGVTAVAGTGHQIIVTMPIAAAANISVDITGITNPSSAGTLYARILTFTSPNASSYTSTSPGTYVDDGGAAMSITSTVGVSGSVQESMIFCASATAVTGAGCSAGVTAPTLQLGETVGSTKALSASAVSTGDIYTQISTNASSGAVVNLKSGVSCGGMKRVEATGCDIAPALTSDISAGQAKFGVKVAPDATNDVALSATGTYQAKAGSVYNGTTYALNWVSGNATGVASVYGDPIMDTNGAPLSNKAVKMTFGASITNTTPAGLYSADMSLIATGKF